MPREAISWAELEVALNGKQVESGPCPSETLEARVERLEGIVEALLVVCEQTDALRGSPRWDAARKYLKKVGKK